jgi:hypothetical protein
MKKKNRIWLYSSFILGFVLVFTNSCKKDENSSDTGNNNTTFPKSYIVGYQSNGSMNVVKYWKDGVAASLSDGTKNEEALSIFVSGTDVYAAGFSDDAPGSLYDDPTKMPEYWKNGVAVPLNVVYFGGAVSGTNGIANSIFVQGGNVYVAGYEEDGSCNDYAAAIWVNGGAPTILSIPYNEDAQANSVFVTESGDVYVAGERNVMGANANQVTLWLNGAESAVTDGSAQVEANSVFVSGSDVYICGGEFNSTTLNWAAVYWKNGAINYLTDGSKFAGANSIYVSGNNVYVAGDRSMESSSMPEATYWKNGVATSLTPKGAGSAKSIYVSGSDVYVCGINETGIKNVATCWKNGTAFPLTDGSETAFATGIFVP